MFFRIPDNFDLTNYRSYGSFAELFNPNVNKIWSDFDPTTSHEQTLGQFQALLKSVYTVENIRANMPVFFQNIRDYHSLYTRAESELLFDRLIQGFPEDLLWTLYFVRFSETFLLKSKFFIYTFNDAKTRALSPPGYVAYRTSAGSPIGSSTGVELYENHKEQIDRIVAAFSEFSDRRIIWPESHLQNKHGVIQNLVNFWRRKLTYIMNERSATFETVLQTGSAAHFEIVDSEDYASMGYNFNVLCRQKISRAYRDPLYTLMSYSTNPCKILDWPLVEPGETKPMLYGVELECAFDYSLKEIIDAQHTPFFIAKADSTITGSKKTYAELVTVPMSLKALKRHYAHWFKNIDYSRFDVTRDTNNGCHVHMDREGFEGKKHIQNLAWFYIHPANRDFLVYVSERGSYSGMEAYSPIPSIPPSLSKVKAYQRSQAIAETKRGIVNFQKKATIEIRMFRGIVSFAELCKNLEFVDAVFNFTRGEKSMNQLTAVHFLKWLRQTPTNQYMTLKKFIDRCKSIDNLITSCEVNDVVFNITDPEKIRDRLNNSKISLTNAHVTLLNKGHKRVFVLNRETGKLDVVFNNRSKLVDLDRSVEARYTHRSFAA